MKNCVIGTSLLFAVAGLALVCVTSFTNDFVAAKFTPVDGCVIANVGAFNSEWDSSCANGLLENQNFTLPTTEFWPLFPLQNPTSEGSPLAPLGIEEFENCTTSIGEVSGAIELGFAKLDGILKVSLGEGYSSPVLPAGPAGPLPIASIYANKALLFGVLGTLVDSLIPDVVPTTPEELEAAIDAKNELEQGLGRVGDCFCSVQHGPVLVNNGTVPVNLCSENFETNKLTLEAVAGGAIPTVEACIAANIAAEKLKQFNKIFNSNPNDPLTNATEFVAACEDDVVDMEKISQAQDLLYVSVGLGGAAVLGGITCLLAGGNLIVTIITALVSAAAAGMTAFALLTVRSAPIYSQVGKEGCVVCYENSTNFYTGIGAIAAPAVAALLLVASICVSSSDDDEESLELVGDKA